MHEALYYEQLADKMVHCLLCPQNCHISDGKLGICRIRRNAGGKLYAEMYGQTTTIASDPVEKKPLYHFYPGKNILSIGTNGCNLRCEFCQNWGISQVKAATYTLTPQDALNYAKQYDTIGIAYTYTEPFIWFEYVKDTCIVFREAGLKNVLVTNGFVNEEPLRELLPYIDAMNIDLKSFRNQFYKNYCGGRLDPVLNTIKISQESCHVELTNLVIPTLNDSFEDLSGLINWVAELNPEIPLHFSRYYPCYKMTIEPTPVKTLQMARELAKGKLKYVYIGNVADEDSNSTFCPNCKKRVILRSGYEIIEQLVKNQRCPACHHSIPIIGS